MKLLNKLILAFLLVTIPTVIVGIVSLYLLNNVAGPLRKDLPSSIEQLSTTSSLNVLALNIQYYDEVLTQSARNYAFTGDANWKTRYNEEAPKLDKIIKISIDRGDNTDKQYFSSIDGANLALVDMETQALDLVDKGNLKEAAKILDSAAYAKQKQIYQSGLLAFTKRRELELDKALISSSKTLEGISSNTLNLINTGITQVGIVLLFSICFSLSVAFTIGKSLISRIETLRKKAQAISEGKFGDRLTITTQDELGQLAQAFNKMSDELRESKLNVDQKVATRTAEIEKLNKYMVGRELKMSELKEQLREYENK